ncbi:hypothetical protein IFM89_024401 [Coptis chinensis]|uniref:Nitrate regulatory gene2 protein n=1 Tax=Coptis chinensis TaxID=261450 RepID=A0A835IH05_9MAGN|nr:hypothetical protein IFM89_024401 [Coptis chinensis]
MGCTQSKIENEEAVTRCKERKQFMKEAVSARNHFASSHSAYTVSLKNTGAALSDYAIGEVHDLHHATSHSTAPPPPVEPLPPPPPPLVFPPPPPLLRATSMPEFVIPKVQSKPTDTILEEDDDDDVDDNDDHLIPRHSRHGSRGGGGSMRGGAARLVEEVVPPPSPPRAPPPSKPTPPPPPPENKDNTWDYFFFPPVHDIPGPSLSQTEESRVPKEEYKDRLKRTEKIDMDIGSTSASISSSSPKVEVFREENVIEAVKKVKLPVKLPEVVVASSNVNLLQILNELDDKFLKASESAYEVSKLLEANRMHYHSNFADNRGHIDHSARLMRVITWNRSIKGLENMNEANDDDFDAHESLASVLDKLLAWEKKLYDEVKAGELMKLEYQRKVALLNKRNKHGTHSEALEKAKSAVAHLHTRYIVDMQSMDSTVSEIACLRDDHLYPKLVSLVDAMARMWETMNTQHRAQMKIVEDLRSLDVSDSPKETSEDHHKRTIQLWGVAEDWHTQFRKLMTHQKHCIVTLNSWLKLNLIPIESNLKEKVSSPPRVQQPPVQALLHVWHENLERLPDQLASSAIYSFSAVMKNIMLHQQDEVKKKVTEDSMLRYQERTSKKTRAYEDWYQKYMERRTPPDAMDPERTEDVNRKDPLIERQVAIEMLTHRLKGEEEAYQKHFRQVREKSLGSLKTHLPELFRAMSDFSFAASSMYKKLLPLTQSQKQSESLS